MIDTYFILKDAIRKLNSETTNKWTKKKSLEILKKSILLMMNLKSFLLYLVQDTLTLVMKLIEENEQIITIFKFYCKKKLSS